MKTCCLYLLLLGASSLLPDNSRAADIPIFLGSDKAHEGIEVAHDVEIGKGGDKVLHAEIAWPTHPPKMPMPALIWIHGGGWGGGTHLENKAMWFASRGYFTASIQYRLSGEARWPAQIEDCKLGVRWLRANAAKYNVNPDHIACWGESAGGHLASCLGTMTDPKLEGMGGYEGVSSKVQAVIDWCGPNDLTEAKPGSLLGFPYETNPDAFKVASPLYNISAGTPPFLVVHGDQDQSVPYPMGAAFVAALKQAGVPVEFITVKGAGHSLNAPAGQPAATPGVPDVIKCMVTFLDKAINP